MKQTDKIILQEFWKKFGKRLTTLEMMYQNHGGEPWKGENIEGFILSKLKEARLQTLDTYKQHLIERIKKGKKKYSPYTRNHVMPEHSPLTLINANREGFNQAISDIIDLIQEEDNEK